MNFGDRNIKNKEIFDIKSDKFQVQSTLDLLCVNLPCHSIYPVKFLSPNIHQTACLPSIWHSIYRAESVSPLETR